MNLHIYHFSNDIQNKMHQSNTFDEFDYAHDTIRWLNETTWNDIMDERVMTRNHTVDIWY